jgi:transposase InsO family protein
LKHWLEVVYMTERIHEALAYVTPAEFEQWRSPGVILS